MTFREETITICYRQVFIFAPVEFQSSFQVLNFVGVSVSRGNLALITRDPFQPLKGLFTQWHSDIPSLESTNYQLPQMFQTGLNETKILGVLWNKLTDKLSISISNF